MVTAGMLPRAAVREVEARLRAAGCPDADFDAAELFRLAAGGDARRVHEPQPAVDAVEKQAHVLDDIGAASLGRDRAQRGEPLFHIGLRLGDVPARRADARRFGKQRHGGCKCVLVKIVLHFEDALRFNVIRGSCRLNGFHFHRISLLRFVLRTV